MHFLVLGKFNFYVLLWLKVPKVLLSLYSLLNLITAHFLKIQNWRYVVFFTKISLTDSKSSSKKEAKNQIPDIRIAVWWFWQDKILQFHHSGGCEQFLRYLRCIFLHWILIFLLSTMVYLRVRYRYLRVLHLYVLGGSARWLIRFLLGREYMSSRRLPLTSWDSRMRETTVHIGDLTYQEYLQLTRIRRIFHYRERSFTRHYMEHREGYGHIVPACLLSSVFCLLYFEEILSHPSSLTRYW